ncbi:MAG: decaprenyl-phosphate phosphoribosyltransferase [Ilumatobacteraceae bacterium]
MLRALVAEARPRQWLKNVLVLAAPGAAGLLDDPAALRTGLLAFTAFCLASSGTYYWNDIHDRHADARHPVKRLRPIASGLIPVPIAVAVSVVLLAGAVILAWSLSASTGLVVALYVVLTTTYSLGLKHVAVVDLVLVASGFVLRAMAGAEAADVAMSTWFVLFTSFGSLFIVTGKRFAELRELGDGAADVRPSLAAYTSGYLQSVVSASVTAALVTYCLWAFEVREVAGTSLPFYELSIVPMAMALLRYLLVLEQGRGSAPEEIFASDHVLQVLGATWLAVFAAGVYAG